MYPPCYFFVACCTRQSACSGHLRIATPACAGAALTKPFLHLCALPIQGSVRAGDNAVATIDRVAVAMARAEALPQDELRRANPRERTLEGLRLEQPELTVGCWASG